MPPTTAANKIVDIPLSWVDIAPFLGCSGFLPM